jgi:hypothetical protein
MQGNKTVIGCIAAILGFAAKAVADVAAGKMPDELTILGFIGGIVGLFGALKGKRIEAKIDALNTKVINGK